MRLWEKFKTIKNLAKEFERNRKFSEYPCEYYLHNALEYLKTEENCGAYMEICWALIKSGAGLREDEKRIFEKYQERFRDSDLEDKRTLL